MRSVTRWRALDSGQRLLVAHALLLVPLVRLSLRMRGFTRTARSLAHRSQRAVGRADLETSRRAAEAVALVTGRSLIGARCLGRSLVLWFVLRRRGIDAELVVGSEMPRDGRLPAH